MDLEAIFDNSIFATKAQRPKPRKQKPRTIPWFFLFFASVSNLSEKVALLLAISSALIRIAIQWKEYSAPGKMVVLIERSMRKKNRCESKVWITGCYRGSAIYHLCIISKKEAGMRLWIFFTLLLIGFASTVEAKVIGGTVPYRA